MKDELREMLFFWGYTNHPNEQNPLAFFNFDDINAEDLSQFKKFKELNEKALKNVSSGEGWDGKLCTCNKDIFGEENVEEWRRILSLPAKLSIKENK